MTLGLSEDTTGEPAFRRHARIIWALLLRELSTRYGRNNIGFLWVVGEPLLFATGVIVLWRFVRTPYEHGIPIIPFVITGYLPIILVRHMISHGMNAVRVNSSLLYHRQLTVLHLFFARISLEFIGVTLAFIVIFLILLFFGQISPPVNLPLVYMGWFTLAWTSFGLAMIFGALGEMFDYVERFVSVITYILVPLSGTFYMAAWLPPAVRRAALYLPFLHSVEMVRGGFFGQVVQTYYSIPYAMAWGAGLTLIGLGLARFVRDRVEIE